MTTPYRFNISNIVINDGTELPDCPLTLIIGPNNAGKSRLLRDLMNRVILPPPRTFCVVKHADISTPRTPREFFDSYPLDFKEEHQVDHNLYYGLAPSLVEPFSWMCRRSALDHDAFTTSPRPTHRPQIAPLVFETCLGKALVAHLSAENRLLLAKTRSAIQMPPIVPSPLFDLFQKGPDTDEEISRTIEENFKKQILLDYSTIGSLCIRVAEKFERRGVDPRRIRDLLKEADSLDDQGDGLRSFTAILTALRVLNRPLFLIDEPEAFLHPPQAFAMGQLLVEEAKENRRLFVSTHSADVLRGVLSKSTDITVLRITRDGGINPCRILKPARLKQIVNTPLLSSSRVLEGLFYSAAIVTEADADTRFYQTLSGKVSKGADVHFVNAANKQTVPRIVALYRELGVRCIGVADFDVINDTSEFQKHLQDLSAPRAEIDRLASLQSTILQSTVVAGNFDFAGLQEMLQALEKKLAAAKAHAETNNPDGWQAHSKSLTALSTRIANVTSTFQRFKELGANALEPEMRKIFDELSDGCRALGLLINPYGELESMLVDCEIPYASDKAQWITRVLSTLANFEVKPEKNAWAFVKLMHQTLEIHSQACA